MRSWSILLIFVLLLCKATGQTFDWGYTIGGPSPILGDFSSELKSLPSGKVVSVGAFNGDIDLDPGSNTLNTSSNGGYDAYIQMVDINGKLLWARTFGSSTNDILYDVDTDDSGNVYACGYFSGTTDFDPGPGNYILTPAAGIDLFVMKLDSNGNFEWARSLGSTGTESAEAVAVLDDGIAIAGGFQDVVNFDPLGVGYNLSANGNFDIFILKLDFDGDFLWALKQEEFTSNKKEGYNERYHCSPRINAVVI